MHRLSIQFHFIIAMSDNLTILMQIISRFFLEVVVRHVQERDREQAERDDEAVDPERLVHHPEQFTVCRAHKFRRCNLSGTCHKKTKKFKL